MQMDNFNGIEKISSNKIPTQKKRYSIALVFP
jgi:hypothetical protein